MTSLLFIVYMIRSDIYETDLTIRNRNAKTGTGLCF